MGMTVTCGLVQMTEQDCSDQVSKLNDYLISRCGTVDKEILSDFLVLLVSELSEDYGYAVGIQRLEDERR